MLLGPEFQLLTSEQLRKLLQEHNICEKIRAGAFKAEVQSCAPARIPGSGTSSIISFYKEGDQYVCTKHRIKTPDGKLIHEDAEDALINGVRYRKKWGKMGI
jgi:hypothetical protein